MKGRKLVFAFDDFYSQFDVEQDREKDEIRKNSKYLMDAQDPYWRSEKLRKLQADCNAKRFDLQIVCSDQVVTQSRSLLFKLNKDKSTVFKLSPHKNQIESVSTVVRGNGTCSTVRSSKQSHGWVSGHFSRLKDRISQQRVQETIVVERLEQSLMEHEEELQRKTAIASHAYLSCQDFVLYLQLQNRYGALPNWMVFGFGPFPGKRYRRLTIRNAKVVQWWWIHYWSIRRQKLTIAALMGQSIFRNKRARMICADRRALHNKVKIMCHRIRFTNMFKCFRSWSIYTERSVKAKKLMRRAIMGTLQYNFTVFSENVSRKKASRHAKLHLFWGRSRRHVLQKSLEEWKVQTHRSLKITRKIANVWSGVRNTIFWCWKLYVTDAVHIRESLIMNLVSMAIEKGVSREMARLNGIKSVIRLQSSLRAMVAKTTLRRRKEDTTLKQRQNQRAKANEFKTARRLEREAAFKIEVETNDEIQKFKAVLTEELDAIYVSVYRSPKKIKQRKLFSLFRSELDRWWLQNIQKSGALISVFSRRSRQKRAAAEVLAQLSTELDHQVELGSKWIKSMKWDHSFSFLLETSCINLIKLLSKNDKKLQEIAPALISMHSWFNSETIMEPTAFIEWYSESRRHSKEQIEFPAHTLVACARTIEWRWLVAAAMRMSLYRIQRDSKKETMDKLAGVSVRAQAATIGDEKLAATRIETVMRAVLARKKVNGRRENSRMEVQDKEAHVYREDDKIQQYNMKRRSIENMAMNIWNRCFNSAFETITQIRKMELEVSSSTKIQCRWRIFVAKDLLLRNLCDNYEKLWNQQLRKYYYFNLSEGRLTYYKPSLLHYCREADDIPTPRAKERDLNRPIYAGRHHSAALVIQRNCRIKIAKQGVQSIRGYWSTY